MGMKLSNHMVDGQFRGFKKYIFGRVVYFGTHTSRTFAERKAIKLIAKAAELESQGLTTWPQDVLASILADNGVMTPPPTETVTSVAAMQPEQKPVKPSMTLDQAFAKFTLHTEARHDITEHTKQWIPQTLNLLKNWLTAKASSVTVDTTLDQIGFDELTWLVSVVTSRPMSAKKKPISVDTVRSVIGNLRDCFNYLADADHWTPCRRFERIFHINLASLKTTTEKTSSGHKSFSIAELGIIWNEANSQQRLYMILGLNCAFTQTDLATLQLSHIKDNGKRIERPRNKTSVNSSFILWKQTQKLLAARIKTTPANDDDLALLSESGKPLVWFGKTKTDSIAHAWNRLIKKVNADKKQVQPLSFKHLRKTAAQMIFNVSDLHVAQMMLAHVGGSVAEQHYVNATNFTKLDNALIAVWRKLESVLVDDKASHSRI